KPATFYHPDFVKIIAEATNRIKPAPKGWLTVNDIKAKTGRAWSVIKSLIEKHQDKLKNYSGWSGIYMTKSNRPTTFYHPDFVDFIADEANRFKPAPEGWISGRGIKNKAGRAQSVIKLLIESHQKELKDHTGWSGIYLDDTGKPRMFYHPDFVGIIVEEAKAVKSAPQGWMNQREIIAKANSFQEKIRRLIREHTNLLDNNPSWSAVYSSKVGKPITFYHPDFVKIIESEAKKRQLHLRK
ncbi:MAG: hypothetical protein KGH66_02245, partial [Candidatus Micrarchaeota archaeon]|nr:hypothetical protein [Candidatus Micrarchaeota archaeon]